jgi:ribosome biogenesis GTPase A
MIITECYPNTNVKVIRIPLDNNSFIYDTPGLGNDNSVQAKIERNALRLLLITSPIKRRNITIAKNQTILLGGLVRIDLLNDEKTALRIYISDKINIKKFSSSMINKQFNKILEKGSLHPTSTNYVRLEQFDAFDILVEEKGPRDIGIQGLGWFSFEGNDQQFRIYVPKGVSIYTSRAKIKNVK